MTEHFRVPFGMPKPKVSKIVSSRAEVSRFRYLDDHTVKVPTDLSRLSTGEVIDLQSDIGSRRAETVRSIRGRSGSLGAGPASQWAMTSEWLDSAWTTCESEVHARDGANDGLRGSAVAFLAEDLRYQVMTLGDRPSVKDILAFASWLLTGQLWHPKWDTAVARRMDEYRQQLVAAMSAMLVPFNVEDPTPETLNRYYHEATGDYLFPTETDPPRTIRNELDAIDSLAATFMRPWLRAHGWIADLKRLQRKKGGAFRENPRASRRPARRPLRSRGAVRGNPHTPSARSARRSPRRRARA